MAFSTLTPAIWSVGSEVEAGRRGRHVPVPVDVAVGGAQHQPHVAAVGHQQAAVADGERGGGLQASSENCVMYVIQLENNDFTETFSN